MNFRIAYHCIFVSVLQDSEWLPPSGLLCLLLCISPGVDSPLEAEKAKVKTKSQRQLCTPGIPKDPAWPWCAPETPWVSWNWAIWTWGVSHQAHWLTQEQNVLSVLLDVICMPQLDGQQKAFSYGSVPRKRPYSLSNAQIYPETGSGV